MLGRNRDPYESEKRITLRRAILTLIGAWACAVAITFAVVFATRAALRHW